MTAALADLRERTETVFAQVLGPVTDAGEVLGTFFALDAVELETAGDDAAAPMDVRLALALRERAILDHLRKATATYVNELQRARDLVNAPLVALGAEDQVRYWLLEATKRPGRRETFQFTPTRDVTISRDFVDANEGFLRVLLVELAQQCEEVRHTQLLASGVPEEDAWAQSRFDRMPSWRDLCEMPELRLSDAEGLGLVGIGIVLGLWSPQPALEQLDEYTAEELDRDQVPFLQPEGGLYGGVSAQ